MRNPASGKPVRRAPLRHSRRRASVNRRGYSIASLMLLMAALAVLLGLAASVFRQSAAISEELAALNVVVGAVGGLIISVVVARSQSGRIRDVLLGAAFGFFAGAGAGFVTAGPTNYSVAFVGSAALLAAAALVRRLAGQPGTREAPMQEREPGP